MQPPAPSLLGQRLLSGAFLPSFCQSAAGRPGSSIGQLHSRSQRERERVSSGHQPAERRTDSTSQPWVGAVSPGRWEPMRCPSRPPREPSHVWVLATSVKKCSHSRSRSCWLPWNVRRGPPSGAWSMGGTNEARPHSGCSPHEWSNLTTALWLSFRPGNRCELLLPRGGSRCHRHHRPLRPSLRRRLRHSSSLLPLAARSAAAVARARSRISSAMASSSCSAA